MAQSVFGGIVYLAIVIGLSFLLGCSSSRQMKVVQGTNLEMGIVLPGTEGALTLDLITYTSGFKAVAPTNQPYSLSLTTTMDNSYFGVVSIREGTSAKLEIPAKSCEPAVVDLGNISLVSENPKGENEP